MRHIPWICTSHFASVALAAIALANPISQAIGPPGIGSKWVYRVHSGDRRTNWTRMIAATASIDGRPCRVATSTDDSGKMARSLTGGPDIRVSGGLLYWDLDTLDVVADSAFVTIDGRPAEMRRIRRFTEGRHGHPYRIGQRWRHEDTMTTHQDGEEISRTVKSYETKVVGREEVLGWVSSRLEYVLVAIDGEPVEPALERTEWWSPDVRGEVKVIIHEARYAEEETRELVSVDLR